jgi:uncharacterized membrane protein YcaP (DUF421 family)
VVRLLFYRPKLDELLQGAPITLIQDGKVCEEALTSELLTKPELMNAAHRQGFESFQEIDRCVLEPGGTFTFYRKHPTDDDQRFSMLLDRIEELTREVRALKSEAK